MYRSIKTCRACGSPDLELVSDFGAQPLANDFHKPGDEKAGLYPLEVMFCHRCSLAQLSAVVNPHVLYDHYSYTTSGGDTMQAHFATLLSDLCALRGKPDLGHVLEIGSNDGSFLLSVRHHSKSIQGVDPAVNLCLIANKRDVPTQPMLWGSNAARVLGQKYDTVVARHVFAHCDDWRDFIEALEQVTSDNSVVFIEVPYAAELLEHGLFDTIYHEHLSYVSIRSINALLERSAFRLQCTNRYFIHGGSIAFILRRREWSGFHVISGVDIPSDNIQSSAWRRLQMRSETMIRSLENEVKLSPVQVYGYGAPAKASIWIRSCGFSDRHIRFVHDTTPQKHGCVMPGTDIPIKDCPPSQNEFMERCVMWCWNFEAEVRRKEQAFLQRGGRFILPLGNNTGSHKVRT